MKTIFASLILFCTLLAFRCSALPSNFTATVTDTNATCLHPCSGSATVMASGGVLPYHYLWTPGNDTTAHISNLCGGTYIVKVTDSLGSVLSDTINIIGPPSPDSVVITTNTTTMCAGDSAYVCVTAPDTAFQYLWSNGSTGSCAYTLYAGDFWLTETDQNGCTVESNHVAITVCPNPPVAISGNGNNDSLCAYTPNGFSGCDTIKWYRNDTLINYNSNCILPVLPGHYTFTIAYDSTCCIDACCCQVFAIPFIVSGISNLNQETTSIYPNPIPPGSDSREQVSVGTGLIGADIEIFDCEGKIVYRSKINSLNTEFEMNVAPGIYLLHIYSQQYNLVRKLVKL